MTGSFLSYNCEIYCSVTVYIHRLHIGFNTTTILRASIYFVYFPPLSHSQLLRGILKIDFKWYHVVQYTPPNISEKSIPTWRYERGSKIRFFSTTKWRKYSKGGRMHHFYIYLFRNRSVYLLVINFLHQYFHYTFHDYYI